VSVLSLTAALSPLMLAYTAGLGPHTHASPQPVTDPPASWYRVSVPAGWTQSTVGDGVRFVRTLPDGAEVVMQLREPVVAVYSPAQVVERLQAAIQATDGIHDALGDPISTQSVNGVSQAYLSRSYVDRAGAPVYLYLLAFLNGMSIGVLQAESRSAAAFNSLRGDVSALATAVRVNGRARSTDIRGALLTPPLTRPTPPVSALPVTAAGRPTEAALPPSAPWPTSREPWPAMADGPRLSGVWTMFESGLRRVYGGTVMATVERAYVYWPDGRVLMTMPSGGVVHPGETQFAGIDAGYWGRYAVRGDQLEMTWGASGKQTYALSRTATNQLDRNTIRPAAPPAHDLRLRGTWEDVGFDGKRWIRFDESGRFATGPIALPNRAGTGTYTIDGYALLLRFDDGTIERLSFVALESGPTPRTITLERQSLPLRR
jgi:hypothetical protein